MPTVTSAFHVHHRQELRAYRRKRFCCLWVDLGFPPKHKPQIDSGTELPPVWLVPTSTASIESQPRAYRPGGELHFRTASCLGPLGVAQCSKFSFSVQRRLQLQLVTAHGRTTSEPTAEEEGVESF